MNDILAGGLHFTTDGFRITYAVIAAVMWLFTTLFSREYFREETQHSSEPGRAGVPDHHLRSYAVFVALTFLAMEALLFTADFMSAFVFFEILSFTSFVWVIHEQSREAISAAYTYLSIAVIGGLILLMGLGLLYHAAGTLYFDELPAAVKTADRTQVFAAAVCILFGFGAKAGMFPLHVWLPKAHPIAPSPASALLSGILTKAGVYGIFMLCTTVMAGEEAFGWFLLVMALITMVMGAVKALLSENLKRTLACSTMSQIGFILTGLAMSVLLAGEGEGENAHTSLALAGSVLHMVNHSFLKLTLFTAAGVVAMDLHNLKLADIRGFGRRKPLLMFCFGVAAAGISGIPLFNGYLSKTLLHEAIVEGSLISESGAVFLRCAEWVFLFSGGCTFAYMLKLFTTLFIRKNEDAARQEAFDKMGAGMDRLSAFSLFLPVFIHVILGIPAAAVSLAGFMLNGKGPSFSPFSAESLSGACISLSIGASLFFLGRVSAKTPASVSDFLRMKGLKEVLNKGKESISSHMERSGVKNFFTNVCPAALKKLLEQPETVLMKHIIPGIIAPVTTLISLSTDAFALLARRSILREKKVIDQADKKTSYTSIFFREVVDAATPLIQNFSFALIMTCIGILLILGILILRAALG